MNKISFSPHLPTICSSFFPSLRRWIGGRLAIDARDSRSGLDGIMSITAIVLADRRASLVSLRSPCQSERLFKILLILLRRTG